MLIEVHLTGRARRAGDILRMLHALFRGPGQFMAVVGIRPFIALSSLLFRNHLRVKRA